MKRFRRPGSGPGESSTSAHTRAPVASGPPVEPSGDTTQGMASSTEVGVFFCYNYY